MAFANIWQWLKTAASNTSLNGIALGENVMLPSGVNNAFRELMSQIATVESKGTAVASAGTLALGTERYYHITGTTPITDIDFTDAVDGRWAWLIFDAALTLTYNATTLKLPGGKSILTEAGDRGLFVQDATDNVICLSFVRAANSGTYTPTSSSKTNVASDTPGVATWTRVDNIVRVTGSIAVTPTAAAPTSTSLSLTLPVTSALAAATELNGHGTEISNNQTSRFVADAANDRAQMAFVATTIAARTHYYSFEYQVL